MRRAHLLIMACIGILVASEGLKARQVDSRTTGREVSANRLITFNGALKDTNGQPRLGTVGITFTLYASREGGEGLWRESQAVQTDEQGRYAILLGATEKEGMPLDVFSNGKAQWLGVQVQGEEEQPRVLLVAVPYALKAADADTVGGKPLSSFVLYEDLTKAMGKPVSPAMIVARSSAPNIGFIPNISSSNSASRGEKAMANGAIIEHIFGLEGAANTLFGYDAGHSLDLNSWYNSFFGANAGYSTTNGGGYNSFFGYNAGHSNTTGTRNSFFGNEAGSANTTAYFGAFFGERAGNRNTEGWRNTFIGTTAGERNVTGEDNTFIGASAGNVSTANENTFVGSGAGRSNTSGSENSFFGALSGQINTTGTGLAFFGHASGNENNGNNNSFFGFTAGTRNTNGANNSFFGYDAGRNNTSASGNSFFGTESGYTNKTGNGLAFFGYQAGWANTGIDNSFFGYQAGYANAGGDNNAFFGYKAGTANTSANYNAFFGSLAGTANTTGQYNSFFGRRSGESNINGGYNSAFGYEAGYKNTTGESNVFVGPYAGDSNTIENYNNFIGAYSNGAAGITNATAIGYRAKVTQSNSLVLGSINGINGATSDTNVGIGTTNPDRQLVIEGSQAIARFTRYKESADVLSPTFAPAFLFERARGSQTTPADMVAGDYLGKLQFRGRVGGTMREYGALTFIGTDTSQNGRLAFVDRDMLTERISFLNSGNVGIGTTTPTERLHVIGNIRVTGSITYGAPETDIPDYVFKPNYKLMSLDEVAKFVEREKHLPNVPPAAEIRKNGLNLADFQMKMLEKIEELTLYTVQQAKSISQKDAEVAALKSSLKTTVEHKDAEVAALNARLVALEHMMGRLTKNEGRGQR